MKALLRLLVVAAAVTLLSVPVASATTVFFSGSGSSGVDSFGDPWSVQATGDGLRDSWGIPGLGEGTTGFLGRDGFTDFHITFNLPDGVRIDSTPATSGTGYDETTRFSVSPFSVDTSSLWTPLFTADGFGVSFIAPSAALTLDPGDAFFLNIVFTGKVGEDFGFSAEWTQTDVTAVPEPATISLLGLGMVGMALRRRRR